MNYITYNMKKPFADLTRGSLSKGAYNKYVLIAYRKDPV